MLRDDVIKLIYTTTRVSGVWSQRYCECAMHNRAPDYVVRVYAYMRVAFFTRIARERERREEHISHARARLFWDTRSRTGLHHARYTSPRYEIRENVRDRAFENIRPAEADEWRRDAQHGEKLTSLGKRVVPENAPPDAARNSFRGDKNISSAPRTRLIRIDDDTSDATVSQEFIDDVIYCMR